MSAPENNIDAWRRLEAPMLLEEFGEDGVFKPCGGAEADWRPIKVIVNRYPQSRLSPDGQVFTPRMTVLVANDARIGIDGSTVNQGGADRLRLPLMKGGLALVDLGIYLPPPGSLAPQDAGLIEFELR